MSLDFTVALIGPAMGIAEGAVRLERHLNAIGFVRSSALSPVAHDVRRGVFDEIEGSAPLKGFDSIQSIQGELRKWEGLAVEFKNDDCSVYVLLAGAKPACINCFIDVNDRALRRMFDAGKVQSFYSAILAIAEALRATCGFGSLEMDFEPMSSRHVIESIWPERGHESSSPAWIGIVAFALMDQEELARLAAGRFRIHTYTAGFWLLESEEYLAFYKGLS